MAIKIEKRWILETKDRWKWLLISFVMALSFAAGFIVQSQSVFLIFILGIASVIILGVIFHRPYLGIAIMLGTMPLAVYSVLPGNLKNFSSITSLFGILALVFFVTKDKNFLRQSQFYDKYLYAAAALLLLELTIGEVFKPISTGTMWFFTYLQLLVLIWLSEKLFNTRQSIEILMILFIVTNIIALVISLPNYKFLSEWDTINRLSGMEGNANEFAIYLAVSVLMLFYFAITTPKILTGVILAIIAIGLIVPIILSGSRGAILFLAFPIALQLWRFQKNRIFFILFILIGLIVLANIVESYIPMDFIQRIITIPHDVINGSDTVGMRYDLWQAAIRLWLQKPIFGIGTEMFRYYAPTVQGVKMLSAHNMYISYLAENGIIGLFLFIMIVVRSVINYEYSIHLSEKNDLLEKLAITWEAIMLCALLNGIKIEWGSNKLLWFCFALSMVIVLLKRNIKESSL